MLWAKGLALDEEIHQFTVGCDPETDLHFYAHDCVASAAHVRMLGRAGLLTSAHVLALLPVLKAQYELGRARQVHIARTQEDCHTKLEAELVDALGETGKRVHLGRSRNDQILVAMRLYLREELNEIARLLGQNIQVLIAFSGAHRTHVMPGYTHMRRAMPASFGLWAAGFAEGLLEELAALAGVHARIDRCPLGAAAGFGVPLPIDRAYTAQLLGFSKVQRAATDCMNSRGRHEQALLDACVSIAGVLEKLMWDLALFSCEEFAFITLPDAFTTGSSIMPQKRNPDVIELARAKCRQLRGLANMHREITTGLPSSYHRDYQLAKGPLVEAVQLLQSLLAISQRLIPALQINTERAAAACTDGLYAAHAAYQLVAQGEPFRDAYRHIAGQLSDGTFKVPAELNSDAPFHIGHANQLCLDELAQELTAAITDVDARTQRYAQINHSIWGPL
jgi:argininosuccinate lyase